MKEEQTLADAPTAVVVQVPRGWQIALRFDAHDVGGQRIVSYRLAPSRHRTELEAATEAAIVLARTATW